MIEVLAGGPLTTVQDLGRPGYAHLGVGRSGAADRASMRLANRLVGNEESAAVLEITLGGLAVRFTAAATVALTGAPCAGVLMNGPIHCAAGDEMRLRAPSVGVRTYLAVRGGIVAPPVLGSCATDLLSGLGPPPVVAGARLAIGPAMAGPPTVDVAPVAPIPTEFVLRVLRGPRADWFSPAAWDQLCAHPYRVTPESNRIGLRLAGPRLERAILRELPPEGMVLGAVQVPPDGQPVLFLADHPVTGGYPVIAVVRPPDVALAAQARPGQTVRFRAG